MSDIDSLPPTGNHDTERMAQSKEISAKHGVTSPQDQESSIYANNCPLRRAVMDVHVRNDGITRDAAVKRLWEQIKTTQAAKPGFLEEFRSLYGLDASPGWADREEQRDLGEFANLTGEPVQAAE